MVWNHRDGVAIDAFGNRDDVDGFVTQVRQNPPRGARIDAFSVRKLQPAELGRYQNSPKTAGFIIGPSVASSKEISPAVGISIPFDSATCDECLAEVANSHDRRLAYPFINCTSCGPRYTIVTAIPYDRQATTMAHFEMCDECKTEYHDPASRRFHAQPNSCQSCGPRLRWTPGDSAKPPIIAAAQVIADGGVAAIKGLGGYHLACVADDERAAARLRALKRREQKPFAVMVADLRAAKNLAAISPVEEAQLSGPRCPIVLLRRIPKTRLAPSVGKNSRMVGLMLPYTALHHLLLQAVGRPLVLTSANVASEPIVTDDNDARRVFGHLVDGILWHDRPIASVVEDSVIRVMDDRPMVFRRGRGYTPEPISLPAPVKRPVVGLGAHKSGGFCIAVGKRAWMGPYLGDLDSLAAQERYVQNLESMFKLLGVRPELAVTDLHPSYFTTGFAASQFAQVIPVQHHYAHMLAVIAEQNLSGDILGVVFDGAGYGLDGELWGGEVILHHGGDFRMERLAASRPLPLPGGERAITQVWRLALAALLEAGLDPDSADVVRRQGPKAIGNVSALIWAGTHAPLCAGMGRWFDAAAALILGIERADFQGHAAMALEQVASHCETGIYDFGTPKHTLDLYPTIRCVVSDLGRGTSPEFVAARFHNTVVEATVAVIAGLIGQTGVLDVVLAGGCFQNAILLTRLRRRLEILGARVFVPSLAPVGDGGIALGQAFYGGCKTH